MDNYIQALEQSLEKKKKILIQIETLSKEQKDLLQKDDLTVEEFEENATQKADLIEELSLLDKGFEQVYTRVEEELKGNRDKYKEEIQSIQKLISDITARSMQIQTLERRNKDLADRKFAAIKKQIREVKASQKAVNQYYQNMMKLNYVDPQFLDNKK